MPFPSEASVPDDVKTRYTGRCLEVWRTIWNSTYERHQDEGRAFATAETAAKRCKTAKSAEEPTMELALKRTGKDTVAGLAIPFGGLFGGRDVEGERFAPETDFALDWFGKSGRPLLYDHGLDAALKTTVVGRQVDYDLRDEGIWAESQLDAKAKYRKAIDELLEREALGYSSGAMPHLAKKSKDGTITHWPWVELSLTPFAAAADLSNVHYVKSSDLVARLEEVGTDMPTEALKAIAGWADGRDAAPDSEQFTDRLVRVSDEVRGLADHAAEYSQMRVKAGRVISAANRERIAAVVGAIDALNDARATLAGLLAETDPEAKEAAKSALMAAVFEAESTLARHLGVPI